MAEEYGTIIFEWVLNSIDRKLNTVMASPKVRLLGKNQDSAVVTYVRLIQRIVDGKPNIMASEETRIWERREEAKHGWLLVHFHRDAIKARDSFSST